MKTLIRLFSGKKHRKIKETGHRVTAKVTAFDSEKMIRLDQGKFIVTNSCAEALNLIKIHTNNNDVIIVIALTPGNFSQEKEAREMKAYYTNKLIICHVIDSANFDDDDQILINCPISSPSFKRIRERESWGK